MGRGSRRVCWFNQIVFAKPHRPRLQADSQSRRWPASAWVPWPKAQGHRTVDGRTGWMVMAKLNRQETHDLSMIIKDRTRVLRAHAEEQAAACLADFENTLASVYTWDHDATWKQAA